METKSLAREIHKHKSVSSGLSRVPVSSGVRVYWFQVNFETGRVRLGVAMSWSTWATIKMAWQKFNCLTRRRSGDLAVCCEEEESQSVSGFNRGPDRIYRLLRSKGSRAAGEEAESEMVRDGSDAKGA